ELWQAVIEKRNLLSAAPPGRWGISPARILTGDKANTSTADRALSDQGGYVRGFEELFDPNGFAIPAEDINALSKIFQWVLHTGREALLGAKRGGKGERIGVVLGNLSYPSDGFSRFAEKKWLDTQQEGARFSVDVHAGQQGVAEERFM